MFVVMFIHRTHHVLGVDELDCSVRLYSSSALRASGERRVYGVFLNLTTFLLLPGTRWSKDEPNPKLLADWNNSKQGFVNGVLPIDRSTNVLLSHPGRTDVTIPFNRQRKEPANSVSIRCSFRLEWVFAQSSPS